uniref:Uncharacterized protein n=1 Tax=Arundo donax TaxID=35708 RepID=A0A0A9GC73_ARUDO
MQPIQLFFLPQVARHHRETNFCTSHSGHTGNLANKFCCKDNKLVLLTNLYHPCFLGLHHLP